MHYRRAKTPGGTYFFTVNLADRDSDFLTRYIDDLRAALNHVKVTHPFSLVAMVVLPDHLHSIWRLPAGDMDYPKRWSLLKAGFSRRVAQGECINPSRMGKRERGIWQRRYWEHQIRDEEDLMRHVDYIHYNPVKHGWVNRPVDWPHSTLHGYIKRCILTPEWGVTKFENIENNYGER
jgi:putative transposase